MFLKKLEQEVAKHFIRNSEKLQCEKDNPFLIEWLDEDDVKMYLLYEKHCFSSP